MTKRNLIILLVLILVAGAAYYMVADERRDDDVGEGDKEGVMCTQDAMECPDGSFVSRVAPSCEFAPCPYPENKRPSAPVFEDGTLPPDSATNGAGAR